MGPPSKRNMSNRSRNATNTTKEDDDFAKAIALSLKDAEKNKGRANNDLYPHVPSPGRGSPLRQSPNIHQNRGQAGSPATGTGPVEEPIKARALYDFEAAEDNELTFMSGEIVLIIDKSDPHWWKGSNHRGEGLFPSNFVTLDLSIDSNKLGGRSVVFNEEVKVIESGPPVLLEPVHIDESKIESCLAMIEEADPSGELRPDRPELATLEEECRQMGPLIDAELEKIDKHHNMLSEMNQVLVDAFSMYSDLMAVGTQQFTSMQPPIHQMQQMSLQYGGPGYGMGPGQPPVAVPTSYAPGQDPSGLYSNMPPYQQGQPGYDMAQTAQYAPPNQYSTNIYGRPAATAQYYQDPSGMAGQQQPGATAPQDTTGPTDYQQHYDGGTVYVQAGQHQQQQQQQSIQNDFNYYANQNGSQSLAEVPTLAAPNPIPAHGQPFI